MAMSATDSIIFSFPKIYRTVPAWLGRFTEFQAIIDMDPGDIYLIELKSNNPQNALVITGVEGDVSDPTAIYTKIVDPWLRGHEGYLTPTFLRVLNKNLERVMPIVEYEADKHMYIMVENQSSSNVTLELVFSAIIGRTDLLREFDKMRRLEYELPRTDLQHQRSD